MQHTALSRLARKCALALLAPVVLASPSQGTTAASVQPVAVMPVTMYGNHLLVKVRVNGSAPLDFVLDTGASDYALNRPCADALGLRLKPLVEPGDIGTGEGAVDIAVAEDVSIALDGVEFAHRTAYVVPFGDLEGVIGRRIDGVLGADVFGQFVGEIDYRSRKLALFDRVSYRYSGSGAIVPLTFSDGRPLANFTIEFQDRAPLVASLLIDTGDGEALNLHTPFVRKHGLPPPGQPSLTNVTSGIAGQARELLARTQCLRLGRFVVARPVAAFALAENSDFRGSFPPQE